MTSAEDIRKAVGVGSIASGALATMAPRLFRGLYGVPNEDAHLRLMTRLWGTRTAVLGALVFTVQGTESRHRRRRVRRCDRR